MKQTFTKSATVTFNKKVMAVAITTALSAGFSGAAFAQEEVEEIVVTGIRASLTSAMDIKRDAAGVVDAISSEDIGKMPDTNLAESMQRISGVSIERSNGEGSKVTIRGIDSELVATTVNGRFMPTVGNSLNGGDNTRAFDFANIASEGVAGVEVFKTSRASMITGGLGGTVNFKTLKPLEMKDSSKAVVNAKAVKDESVISGREYTPELSGLYGWHNDEGTFGVVFASSYQVRDSGRANAYVNNWALRQEGMEGQTLPLTNAVTKAPIDYVNKPKEGQLYNLPSDLRYAADVNTRTRTNNQLTMQFKPVENFTATVDYLYSGNEIKVDRSQQSTWYDVGNISAATFDNNTVKTPLIYQQTFPGDKDIAFGQDSIGGKTTNNSLGINLAYEATDDLSFTLDAHNSSSGNVYFSNGAGLAVETAIGEYADFSKDLPVMGWTINDNFLKGDKYRTGNNNGKTDAGDATTSMGTFARTEQEARVEQIQLGGTYKLGDLGFLTENKLDFGVGKSKNSNHFLDNGGDDRVTMGNWAGVDPARFKDHNFRSRDFGSLFKDYGSTTGDKNFNHQGIDADPRTLLEIAEAMYALNNDPDNFNNFVNGKAKWNGKYNTDRTIQEDISSVFVQLASKFDVAGMPANLLAGLRAEKTNLTAISSEFAPTMMRWDSDNDWTVLREGVSPDNVTKTSNQTHALPSMDFDLALTDSIKGRLSVGQTIGRPKYASLKPDCIISPYERTAECGNPELEPMKSTNFDLSAEWYYTDDSYASVGYFRKDVSQFIGNGSKVQPIYGLRDIRSPDSARYQKALANLKAANKAVTDENLFNQFLIDDGKWDGMGSPSPALKNYASANDPLVQWKTTLEVNNRDATIDGVELSVQHIFGESGFGFQANYTMVDSSAKFDFNKKVDQFALNGVSDTANLVAFYDKNGFQARLAYNWRDAFLDRTNVKVNEPRFTEAFSQIDFTLGYNVTDNLSVSLEGLNITGNNKRQYGRSEAQMLVLEDLFARYNLGVRYSF